MASKYLALSDLVNLFQPGERLYIAGSGGEPVGLLEALCTGSGPPVHLTTSFAPGINPVPLERLAEGSTFTCMFAHAVSAGAQARGSFRHIPLSYGLFAPFLAERLEFDTCIVHVSTPDARGQVCMGPSVEFTDLARKKSSRTLAVINPNIPHMPRSRWLSLDNFAAVAELETPLREYDVGVPSAQAAAIAGHIAAFIDDGAAVQVGLGKVPDALMRLLTDRKRLRLFSGMLSDGARDLAENGCLDRDCAHTGCVYVGSQSFYRWLDGRTDFTVTGCDVTHDIGTIVKVPGLVAVNSAVSVDLFGQANIEMLGGRMISGAGGGPDYARGAAAAGGSVSIIALPSVSGKGDISRIVPALDGVAALPRHDIEVVVTEHGAADLRGCTVKERAERIAGVAAPQHRAALQASLSQLLARL
jgi:acyl-CoA hydrolase